MHGRFLQGKELEANQRVILPTAQPTASVSLEAALSLRSAFTMHARSFPYILGVCHLVFQSLEKSYVQIFGGNHHEMDTMPFIIYLVCSLQGQ